MLKKKKDIIKKPTCAPIVPYSNVTVKRIRETCPRAALAGETNFYKVVCFASYSSSVSFDKHRALGHRVTPQSTGIMMITITITIKWRTVANLLVLYRPQIKQRRKRQLSARSSCKTGIIINENNDNNKNIVIVSCVRCEAQKVLTLQRCTVFVWCQCIKIFSFYYTDFI